jgi:hypothetical protein
MPQPTQGATYGDAAIFLVSFAETHPWRFLLTMLPTLSLGLLVFVVGAKVLVLGPVTDHLRAYGDKRSQTRRDQSRLDNDPRLPE